MVVVVLLVDELVLVLLVDVLVLVLVLLVDDVLLVVVVGGITMPDSTWRRTVVRSAANASPGHAVWSTSRCGVTGKWRRWPR